MWKFSANFVFDTTTYERTNRCKTRDVVKLIWILYRYVLKRSHPRNGRVWKWREREGSDAARMNMKQRQASVRTNRSPTTSTRPVIQFTTSAWKDCGSCLRTILMTEKDIESHLIDQMGTRKPEGVNERLYWPLRAVSPAVGVVWCGVCVCLSSQRFSPCELNCRDLTYLNTRTVCLVKHSSWVTSTFILKMS